MNPFAWPGPKFLAFFAFVALAAIVAVALKWRAAGKGRATKGAAASLTSDPYGIAYLRGSTEEAIKIAVFNLVDRGILSFSGGLVRPLKTGALDLVKRPLDKAIVRACASATSIKTLVLSRPVRQEAEAYGQALAKPGYMADDDERASRRNFGFAVIAVLMGIAGAKVLYALSQGRSNIAFLIFAALFASMIVLALSSNARTLGGHNALASLKTLMTRAKSNSTRLKPGGETNEALLLASVFGVHVLPGANFPLVEQMYPRPSGGDSSSGGDGGSSCSSGCGGGGGCGGCGG